jgi:glutamate racemase
VTTAPIGVFDSGVGGLSVLRALRAELPHERFVYVADSGHAPYGERDDAHVIARSHAIADHLIATHGIKALVVACNTATAAAILQLRAAYPALPIVGIEPALKPATVLTQTGVIGVMATRGTLQSQKFGQLLASLQGTTHFVLQACDGLADAIEHNNATKIIALSTEYTSAMGRFGTKNGEIDTLVLGCTHYPFIADLLLAHVQAPVTLVDGGLPVARQTRRLLTEKSMLAEADGALTATSERLEFFSTGSATALSGAALRWMQMVVTAQAVNIPSSSAFSEQKSKK